MPTKATMADEDALSQLTQLFPLTNPVPNPAKDPALIPAADIALEQELLRNPDNPRQWLSYIEHITSSNFHRRPPPDDNLSSAQIELLGPLASASQRLALQRIVSIYERALAVFPTNYRFWKAYLDARAQFVLGPCEGGEEHLRKMVRAGRKNLEVGPTLLEEDEDREKWETGLDGLVGWVEWRSLAAAYERALMWLPRMPRIWLSYLSMFNHPRCPPILSHTHARRTFDRALRTLPGSLHLRIWKVYLRWAEERGGETCLRVWRRYLRVDPSLTERYVAILLSQPVPRALEAAKLLLGLARRAAAGTYKSPEGKSPYQLLIEWLELCEKYPEEVGLEPEEAEERRESLEATKEEGQNAVSKGKGAQTPKADQGAKAVTRGKGKAVETSVAADPETDPMDSSRLNVGYIVENEGLSRYTDQAGRLWTGLATYWIRRGALEAARDTFERGIASVVTVRDFTQIFDAYAETSEQVISFLMEELAEPEEDEEEDEEEEGEGKEDKEAELDERMKEFEQLMERRPFLVNDVLLRRNPHDVQEWEKRVALFGNDDAKVIETYKQAIDTINPRKATANLHQLYLNFARFYEEGGSAGSEDPENATPDLPSARKIFERATQVPLKRVDELAEVWCEWAEMEVRHGNYDEALRVLSRSVAAPRNAKHISFHDESLPVQSRLFKSLKLWSFYVDLEESLGTVEGAKGVYDRIMELKIANPQIIVNYAAFLEENKYFEEAFKVYERGVELFTYPVAFEIWNVYLSKFVKRYAGNKIERARDLFEQALEKCPAKFAKPLFLMYGALEEEHGLAKRAMNIYDRATKAVGDEDRFDMFTFYIAKAAANFGLASTRPLYERAIEALPDRQTAEMCMRFAQLERKLGEIDRARAIYAHASQFCDPRTRPEFWKEWNAFEIETGSEDTFREMLRIKRSVQAQFNTDVSYIAASALSAQQRNAQNAAAFATAPADPMAAAEAAARAGAGAGGAGRQAAPAFVVATQSANVQQSQAQQAEPEKNEEQLGGEDDDDLL